MYSPFSFVFILRIHLMVQEKQQQDTPFASPLIDQLNTFSPWHISLLYLLAFSAEGMAESYLLKILQQRNEKLNLKEVLSRKRFSTLLLELTQNEWIQKRQEGLYEGNYILQEERVNSVLLHLYISNTSIDWRSVLETKRSQNDYWHTPSPQECQRELWLSLLKGERGDIEQWSRQWLIVRRQRKLFEALPPLEKLLTTREGIFLFEYFTEEIQVTLLADVLEEANRTLEAAPKEYRYILSRFGKSEDRFPVLVDLLAQQAFFRNDRKQLETLSSDIQIVPWSFLQDVAQGHYDQAVVHMEAWDKELEPKKRKNSLPHIFQVFLCLALLGCKNPKSFAALKTLVTKKRENSLTFSLLEMFVERLPGVTPSFYPFYNSPSLNDKKEALIGLEGILLALVMYWNDDPDAKTQEWQEALETFQNRLAQKEYEWAAQEIDALTALQFAKARRSSLWHEEHHLIPLVNLYKPQDTWSYALTSLAALQAGTPVQKKEAFQEDGPKGGEPTQERLAWFVVFQGQEIQFLLREQKLGAKGQWSQGRSVSLKKLTTNHQEFGYLTPQDIKALGEIRKDPNAYGEKYIVSPRRVLPHLIGHPFVFLEDTPGIHVDIVEGKVALHLKEESEHITLALVPEVKPDDKTIWIREMPTRLVVYSVSKKVRHIAKIIGKRLVIPHLGKTQLMTALTHLASLLPIHSNISKWERHIETLPADKTLYAYLLPAGQGIRLQFLVRPLPGGSWFKPGHGLENILGEQKGKAIQVIRDLEEEGQAYRRILEACPSLPKKESDNQEWALTDPLTALETLSELQELQTFGGESEASTPPLECIWPEGEHFRIKAQRGTHQMKLCLKQHGDWFALNGEIILDDGRVLQLRQLLDLLSSSPGRFLKLGEKEWLALSGTFRKRLDEVAALADHTTEDGVHISPLATHTLQGLSKEVETFTADSSWKEHIQKLESSQNFHPEIPSTFQAELREYQKEGYYWLARLAQWGAGACLADDMGVGKTVQMLALLLARAEGGPQLVVAPPSVILNWASETRRFAPPLKVSLYHEKRALEDLKPFDLLFTSYGLLQQDITSFTSCHWHSVILDEAQAIKNSQTKRSQAVQNLKANFKMVATGTPVENHLGELWSLFRFINPGLLGSQERFIQRFVEPIERKDEGARRTLKMLLQPFILRRTKAEVLSELPPRTDITLKIPLSSEEAALYEALRRQAVEKLSDSQEAQKGIQVLAEITKLRRFCCSPQLVKKGSQESSLTGSKMEALIGIVEELLDNGHKALIFSQFIDHLTLVRHWLEKKGISYQYLDGSISMGERKKRIDAFQEGTGDLFLISLKAGGTGLNLTAANTVIHLDPWWNPAVEDQASDRAHRIGQQRPVTIYRLVAEHTIEEHIIELHAAKRDLADSLLEGSAISGKLNTEALFQLLKAGSREKL